jgi:hypothetical protein
MERTKLTVRVDREVLARAKEYARVNETTLTRLVDAFLRRTAEAGDPLGEAPTVRRLSGILAPGASVEDYLEYIEEKYAA